MELKQVFTASRFASPSRGKSVNLNVLILLPIIGLSFAYPLAAAFNPTLLERIDVVLSPIVDALRWVGLGIVKPPMDGPFPARLYLNETGIAVWGAVIYTLASIVLAITGVQPLLRDREEALQSVMQKYEWGRVRAWIFARAVLFLFFIPLVVYCTACLLNGIYGWYVFHIDAYSVVALPTLCFVLPGAIAAQGWLAVINFIFRDCASLVLSIFRLFRRQ